MANSASCKPTATGTLTDTDVDNTPNTFTAIDSPKASTGGYGTFTMTTDGVWTYTLDNTNCAVQALNVCDKLTDCFTVTTIDGTPQVVTITINGANDAAVICGATTGSVTEAGACTYGTPIATGTLTDTDVDNTPNTFTAVCAPKASDAGYGTFTMTADGVWTYKLDNANCEVQALNDCDTLTDCFEVTTIDGTTQVVTITINGADDTFHFKDKMSDVKTSEVIDLAEDIPASISSPRKRCSNQCTAGDFRGSPNDRAVCTMVRDFRLEPAGYRCHYPRAARSDGVTELRRFQRSRSTPHETPTSLRSP